MTEENKENLQEETKVEVDVTEKDVKKENIWAISDDFKRFLVTCFAAFFGSLVALCVYNASVKPVFPPPIQVQCQMERFHHPRFEHVPFNPERFEHRHFNPEQFDKAQFKKGEFDKKRSPKFDKNRHHKFDKHRKDVRPEFRKD